jgi:hypothetical protein
MHLAALYLLRHGKFSLENPIKARQTIRGYKLDWICIKVSPFELLEHLPPIAS